MNFDVADAWQSTDKSMQRGQAMTEMLLVVPVLWAVLMAVALLGEWQDQALRADQAGRHGAFGATLRPMQQRWGSDMELPVSGPLPGRASAPAVTVAPQTEFRWQQPGAGSVVAERLRHEWSLDQADLLVAEARARPARQAWSGVGAVLVRRTVILAGAGHAADDRQVQRQLAASDSTWGHAYGQSRLAGQDWVARLRQVDAGWGRHLPDFDWLTAWAGQVPSAFLSPKRRKGDMP